MKNKFNRLINSKSIEYLVIATLLLLGLILRLYKIDNPIADWHSFRQADTASVGKFYVESGVDLLFPKYHDISTTQSGLFNPEGYRFVEFPLFSAIHAYLLRLFPFVSFDVIGRLVSILSSLISAYLLFLLGKRFISTWGGILTLAFYCLLPFNIYFTRVILPEPLSVVLGLLGLLFFIKYYDHERFFDLILSSLMFALGILVKPYIIFYGLPVLFLAFKKYGFKNTLINRKLLIAAVLVILPFVFWRFWMNKFPEGIPFWEWTFNGDGIRFRPSFWRWIFGERLTKLILGFWGLVPFVFGLIDFKKDKRFIHFFLLAMFLYVSVFATANVRHDYYQTIVVPAVCLALASGVTSMWNFRRTNVFFVRSLLIFSLLIALVSSTSEIKEFYKINHPEIIEAGQAVQRAVPKDRLIIAPYNGDTAFLYQTGHRGWPVVDRPIDELIEKGANYFVSVDLGHYQTVEFGERFQTVEKTDSYIIFNLNEEKL